jgi:formylmethanofuran dehydrogenase subunit E
MGKEVEVILALFASSAKRRGTCAACGEQQALGELYQGKFLCGECYAEKLGIPGLE